MSRADVARQSGLSEGAVSRIVNSLIKGHLVREDGAENSTGGRPGRRLALESKRLVFGAEIQNWETRCALSTMHGRIVETQRFRTPASLEQTLDRIADLFKEFSDRLGPDRLPGLGICARGVVNSDTGVLIMGSRPGWTNIPIRDYLESRTDEPVFVENNVRAAALAEYTYGTAELLGSRCFVFVKVDEGVGTGILFDGKLYHGPNMAAGEFGQMIIESSASRDSDDRPVSLEQLISNPSLCNRFDQLSGGKRQLSVGDTSARARRVAQWAAQTDDAALQTLTETARYLGIAIANIVWGLDADTVVIDTPITEAWHLVEPLLRQQLPDRHNLLKLPRLVLRPSALGGAAALIGAATLPLTAVFASISPVG